MKNLIEKWRTQPIIVLCVIAIAVLLRLVGINYGLPNLFITDEYHEVMRALELGSGEFNFERTSKGGLYFILLALYGIYFSILAVWQGLTIDEFVVSIAGDPTPLYLIGRYVCVVISVLTMLVVYKTCQTHVDRTLAPAAVLLVAVNILDIEISRQIRVDVLLSFFSMLCLYFTIEYAKLASTRSAFAVGLTVGLATTTKVTGVLLFFPIAIAYVYTLYRLRDGENDPRTTIGNIIKILLCFALVLSITNPGIWTTVAGYLKFAPTLAVVLPENQDIAAGRLETPLPGSLLTYYYQVMADKFGLLAMPLTIIGGLLGVVKRQIQIIIIFAFVLVTFIVVSFTGNSTMYYPRYLLPIVAPTAVIIVYLLSVVRRMPLHNQARITVDCVISVVLIGFVVSVGSRAYTEGYILTYADTREIAAGWIQQNLDEGENIAVEGTKITAARNAVPVRETSVGIRQRAAYFDTEEPRQAKFLRHLDRAYSLNDDIKRFDLYFYDLIRVPKQSELAASQVGYVIVEPERLIWHRSASNKSREFYDYLKDNRNAELVYSIHASPNTRPGPTVEIYRLRQGVVQ